MGAAAPSANNIAVQILPYLYLGPHSSTAPVSAVALGITHIISVGARPHGGHASISYHRLSLADDPSADITKPALLAAEVIEAARQARPDAKILVHCVAGISRSPAIIASYLVREAGMTLRQALAVLVRARPNVRPNDGFVVQLKELEQQIRGETSLEPNTLPVTMREKRVLLELDSEAEPEDLMKLAV